MRRFLISDFFFDFKRSKITVVAFSVAFILILACALAPFITPQDPFNSATLNLMDGMLKPLERGGQGQLFLFGSDDQGRDIYSATLYGARMSLLVGLASVAISLTLGVSLGLIAGFAGGKTDAVIMRLADIQLSFPAILIALLVFGVGKGLIPTKHHEEITIYLLVIAIGLSFWAQYARTVRALTLVEKNKEYVQAARLIGRNPFVIMLKHILPNILTPTLVIVTINLAQAIIEEATLSFLGTGMTVTQPSLGTLLRFGQRFLFSGEYWMLFYPALMLVLLALSINLLGDWLRDALNPKLQGGK
jgi:peptide/nickel transport system permease protein